MTLPFNAGGKRKDTFPVGVKYLVEIHRQFENSVRRDKCLKNTTRSKEWKLLFESLYHNNSH